MSTSDKRICAAIVVIILMHIAILTIGLTIPALSFLIELINLGVGVSMLVYWTQKQIRITQHVIELREIAVLCFEIVIISCAGYALFVQQTKWLTAMNFVILGTHLFVSILLFIFMITFKMKKLF